MRVPVLAAELLVVVLFDAAGLRVVVFFAGAFARRSASSSDARSSVISSTESPLRRLAFVSPSVT